MKRFVSFMIAASIAALFASCQKQDVEIIEDENVVSGLVFSSEKPAFDDMTKTEWTGETIRWSAGDYIRVAYTCNDIWQNKDGSATADEVNGAKTAKIYASDKLAEAAESAQFYVPVNFTNDDEGEYVFYGVYPSAAVSLADMIYAPSVTVEVPSEQTPLANSFDSKADLMASKSAAYDAMPKVDEPVSLQWSRLVAHGYITLKGLPVDGEEELSTITLTADSEADMVGSHYLYLDTYNVVKPSGNTAANTLTINADYLTLDNNGNVTFWACFLPCTWTALTVQVETDKATYTREIATCNLDFKKNARNILTVNMVGANRVASAAAALPFERDFSTQTGSSELNELDGFKNLTKVYKATGAIRLANGNTAGVLETTSLDLSQKFHVVVSARGWDDNELIMHVSAGEQEHDVALVTYGETGNFAEYVINFDAESDFASVKFEAASGKRYYIKDIKIRSGNIAPQPVLTADAPDQISAAGGEGSFTYLLMNPVDGESVTATSSVDWITEVVVDKENSIVTYTVAANTSDEPREGTVVLSYEGIEDVYVAVAQLGNSDATPYLYTFNSKVFTENNQTEALNGLDWTLNGTSTYFGYDGTKGQQFGKGAEPNTELTLSTSDYKEKVKTIKINTSGAASINATLIIKVNGVQYGDQIILTSTATDYTVNAPDGNTQTGEIVFSYTQTSSKAIYIKSISIN